MRMGTTRRGLRLAAVSAVAGAVSLLSAGSAAAAVFLYAGTDVPKTIGEGESASSTVTVPPGFGAVTDVDVAHLGLTAFADASDQTVSLRNPAGLERLIVNNGCTSYPGGSSFTLDQQAQTNPFGGAGTCPPGTGTYRPSNSGASSTPLTDLLGQGTGTWTLTYADAGVGGSGGTLGSWGLRVTHAPIKLSAKAKKRQRVLSKRVKITVRCNADCTLRIAGDAKPLALSLSQGRDTPLSVRVKAGALRRSRHGEKLRLELDATGRFGEVDSDSLAIAVVRTEVPERPAACAAGALAVTAC